MPFAETDWERVLPYRELEPSRIAHLVGPLGRPVRIQTLTHGKANTNLKVHLDTGAVVVLRLHERDKDSVERERHLLERVREVVPVPRQLHHDRLPDGTPVSVLSFEPGRHPADWLDDSPAHARAIGEALGTTLGTLHAAFPAQALGRYGPDLSLQRRFSSVSASLVDLVEWSLRVGRARRRLLPEETAALRRSLPAIAAVLDEVDEACLSHGDFKSPNVLLTRADGDAFRVSAVLDWEFASPFSGLLDIAILLRHHDLTDDPLVAAFSAAYQRERPLPHDWRHKVRVLDLMNLVGFLNARGERPVLYADVRARLRRTLAMLGREPEDRPA